MGGQEKGTRKITRRMERDREELAHLFADIPPDKLRDALLKDEMITLRVTATEKEEMKTMAKALGRTLTEYLLGLHRLARESLAPSSQHS